ncbi:hypothetical protein ABW45_11770 [Stenotrophomonas maltophilia]|nr:hypothetical protein ABW45_11770 [Stenotrophomonas maltophilia]
MAIVLSVTLIAKWYVFGMENSPLHSAWQAVVITSTCILLALPLGLALREIWQHTSVANQARAMVARYLGDRHAWIEHISVARAEHRHAIDAVAMVPAFINNAQGDLAGPLSARLTDRYPCASGRPRRPTRTDCATGQISMARSSTLPACPPRPGRFVWR